MHSIILLEEYDKEEYAEVTEVATISCLKSITH